MDTELRVKVILFWVLLVLGMSYPLLRAAARTLQEATNALP